jgi:hypothetical protein
MVKRKALIPRFVVPTNLVSPRTRAPLAIQARVANAVIGKFDENPSSLRKGIALRNGLKRVECMRKRKS